MILLKMQSHLFLLQKLTQNAARFLLTNRFFFRFGTVFPVSNTSQLMKKDLGTAKELQKLLGSLFFYIQERINLIQLLQLLHGSICQKAVNKIHSKENQRLVEITGNKGILKEKHSL